MKPVYQTQFGDGEGNCFAACLASLLEMEIEFTPDFYQLYKSEWFNQFTEWMRPLGMIPYHKSQKDAVLPLHDCYYLVGGTSPRGISHSVIYLNGKMVHDPHPSGEGLAEIEDVIFMVRTFK